MTTLEDVLDASPLEAPCPICRAQRGEPCAGGSGQFHTARQLLRIAELEAVGRKPIDMLSASR